MVIQQTYLLSRFVKTASEFASAGCSPPLRSFRILTLLTRNATIIILGCQEVGQNETFIAPQRAYYLPRKKKVNAILHPILPSVPIPCSSLPPPPPRTLLSSLLSLFVLCVSTQWSAVPSFTSASHILWLRCSTELPSFPPSSLLLASSPDFDRAST